MVSFGITDLFGTLAENLALGFPTGDTFGTLVDATTIAFAKSDGFGAIIDDISTNLAASDAFGTVSDSSLVNLPASDAFGTLGESFGSAYGLTVGTDSGGVTATGSASALIIGIGTGWSYFSIPIYASNSKFYPTMGSGPAHRTG